MKPTVRRRGSGDAAAPGSQGRPRKRFGQHFLVDAGVITRIADCVGGERGSRVVEIGGGRGALTAALVARGFALTVIEVDRDLAALLTARFPDVDVRVADALRFDFANCIEPGVRIVGNLPYNISTPLLLRLAPLHSILDMTFMLQAEVVDRIVAAPGSGDYGRLTVMLGYYCTAQPLFNVGSHAFRPQPRVQSRMVRLVPRPVPAPPALFADVVRAAFGGRRKMLRNGLAGLAPATALTAALAAADIDATRRPETLTVAEFARLAGALAACGVTASPARSPAHDGAATAALLEDDVKDGGTC